MLGVSLHCVITSFFVAILIDDDHDDYFHHYSVMQNYLRQWKIDNKHRRAVHEYSQYQWETTRGTGNVKRILQSLPVSVRNALKYEMAREFFEKSIMFEGMDDMGLVYIVDGFTFKTCAPKEVIFKQGEYANKMFFCKSGHVSIIRDGSVCETRWCGGTVCGEYELVTGDVYDATMEAITYSEIWIYRVEQFTRLLQRKQEILKFVITKLAFFGQDQLDRIMTILMPDDEFRARFVESYRGKLGQRRA
jgi:hypothetical protein